MIGRDLERAAQFLREDQVVAIPTETVYGLAGNIYSPPAIGLIYKIKQRPSFNPLIIHLSDIAKIDTVAENVPDSFFRLAEKFSPGPITYILPRHPDISNAITAGLETVAVRIPAHPMTQELLQMVPFPVAAPSANPFGYISPTKPEHVEAQLGTKVPYILDGGPCEIGLESTIISLLDQPRILRSGAIGLEQVRAILPELQEDVQTQETPEAPGMLKSHYAPGKPTFLGSIPSLLERYPNQRKGILAFKNNYLKSAPSSDVQVILSPTGDLDEAARKLYSALRELDRSNVDLILCETVQDKGIGKAINDRLRKASFNQT